MESGAVTLSPCLSVHSRFAIAISSVWVGYLANYDKIEGYIDTNMEVGVTLTVFGMEIGHFYGNLTDGLVIRLNLLFIDGTVKLYLQNVKEVWLKVDVNVMGYGMITSDQKVLTL